jgi:predicted dehydrogenase
MTMRPAHAILGAALAAGCASNGRAPEPRIRLMVLEPGHFHAALVLKTQPASVSPVVDVYAEEGPELDDFLGRVKGYNSRAVNPTAWELRVHSGPDALGRMLAERPGNVVVMAGNNRRKTEAIEACAAAGLNVLADKPMCIDPEGFRRLENAFRLAGEKGVLVYDIMTERYEATNRLQRELVARPDLFGEPLAGSADDPCAVKESVHHFYKTVSGSPVKRPAWFFDTAQQGEGIVDVTTHLVDLVQWALFHDRVLDAARDFELVSARRWPCRISEPEFARAVQAPGFPAFLAGRLDPEGRLPVFANGEIVYRLGGLWIRVKVEWRFEAPPGGSDTHFSVVRGTRAGVAIRQGAEQGYRPELYVEPAPGVEAQDLERPLSAALAELSGEFPGLGLAREGGAWRVVLPDAFRVGHEAHFGQVASAFFGYLDAGRLPEWEEPNMLAKYFLTTRALEEARR